MSVIQRGTDMTSKTLFQLIRRPEVLALTGRSKSALQLDEKAGVMPTSISIGDRAVAYIKYEIDAVIQARMEGQTKEQIKGLVAKLIADRQSINGGA